MRTVRPLRSRKTGFGLVATFALVAVVEPSPTFAQASEPEAETRQTVEPIDKGGRIKSLRKPTDRPSRLLSKRVERVTARPEVLCGALSVFGLVEPGLQSVLLRNGAWECSPVLANVEPVPEEGPATSLFTLVRGRGSLDPPTIRIKLNELDPATSDSARNTVLSAMRSAVRNYGMELPTGHIAALEDMERVDRVENGLRLRITPEMGDARRLNILLEFVGEPEPEPTEAASDMASPEPASLEERMGAAD
ncbi:hypothetical protein D5400_15795 [Georhizobium profundi]|uniref:POTRA domain-containing protein n=1 Tax=Georhizobium profundi TaxID=2341112 RepID=A0A3S9B6J8_9HYPH|nr:hypothetical protein D5400_15795 [Georhizobium profundi]